MLIKPLDYGMAGKRVKGQWTPKRAMTNREQGNEEETSLQLIESLKKEILLMREILSEYTAEEEMIHRGAYHLLPTIRENQNNLKQEINQVRKNRVKSHIEKTTDFNIDILTLQIEALSQEIINKMSLIKCIASIPKKVKPKKKKNSILLLEEDV